MSIAASSLPPGRGGRLRRAWFQRTLMALAVLVTAIVVFVGFVAVDGIPRYAPGKVDLHVEVTPARVARGRKLAALLCNDCHLDPATQHLTGHRMSDLPAAFGTIFSANITADHDHGVGGWTDGELAYLLRTGVRRDGRYLPPWMVKLPHSSDEDLASVIAFLRSDDPRVAAQPIPAPGVSSPSFLTKLLTHVVMKPLPYPTAPVVAPPRTDKVAYGRYLALSLDCFSCHSADFKTIDILSPAKSPGFFGGGNQLTDVRGRPVLSANLTPDDATGIGRWTEAEFVRALRKGFRPDGHVLRYPMMPKPDLDDEEAAAIYAYLRTVPPLAHAVDRRFETASVDTGPGAAGGQANAAGRALYQRYGCMGCHGDAGVGLDGLADLRQVNAHFVDDRALRAWVDDAPIQKPGTHMPGWRGVIHEEDYAPLFAFVRALGRTTAPAHD